MVASLPRSASSWTTGATPCAEKMTMLPSGTSSVSLDEDRALLLQGLHDVLVVDDLVADVDRGAVLLQGLLDGDHGAVHARAVATGGGEQDTALVARSVFARGGGGRRAGRGSHASHRKAVPGRRRSRRWPRLRTARQRGGRMPGTIGGTGGRRRGRHAVPPPAGAGAPARPAGCGGRSPSGIWSSTGCCSSPRWRRSASSARWTPRRTARSPLVYLVATVAMAFTAYSVRPDGAGRPAGRVGLHVRPGGARARARGSSPDGWRCWTIC